MEFVSAHNLGQHNSIDKPYAIYVFDYYPELDIYQHIDRLGKPDAIIHTEAIGYQLRDKYKDIPVYGISKFAEYTVDDFFKLYNLLPKEKHIDYCFSFTANRPNPNRHILIHLLKYLKLSNFDYTWSGTWSSLDLSDLLQEISNKEYKWLTPDLRSALLSPITNFNERTLGTAQSDGFKIDYQDTNAVNYWNSMRPLYENSLVHLITASPQLEKMVNIDEKYIQTVVGMNIPIFVGGGWKQVEFLESLGFDMFSDIVDHSYQHCETLLERCYCAVVGNLELLTDIEKCNEMSAALLPRFKNNIEHLFNSECFGSLNNSLIESFPGWASTFLKNKLVAYRNSEARYVITKNIIS